MTQSNRMPFRCAAWLALLALASQGSPAQEESFQVVPEHPRLFLRPQRLRLLQRERERRSPRWQQFELLISGHARMPEPGFTLALYYQVAGSEEAGRRAIEWALSSGSDLRQLALVFDWCQPLLDPQRATALAGKLARALDRPPRSGSVAETRSRALAAIAVAERAPKRSEAELSRIVRTWWRAETVPALKSGRPAVPRGDLYALTELMHAIRDNVNVDLRASYPDWFKRLPLWDLISYYPAIYPAPQNDYRIPAVKGAEPDLTLATFSRAAELAMVAFDNNALENQYLQGWAMHDRFLLRGPLGIPYEFLWANPYQPGLSYYTLPLVFHDPTAGRLFVRSSWGDDAFWLGCFDGQLQTFSDGEPKVVAVNSLNPPLYVAGAAVAAGSRFELTAETRTVMVIGLAPSRRYDVEPDGQEMSEETTDRGGILELKFPGGFRGGVRLKPVP